ncbi:hypothetical protein SDC9_80306 [bioreactor metagenome]|uniref:Uncharacterized protein n=1 Tax=bioreactor metagenome TaxID=1076179 RepID=A0A644Z0A9_9ZZZZ
MLKAFLLRPAHKRFVRNGENFRLDERGSRLRRDEHLNGAVGHALIADVAVILVLFHVRVNIELFHKVRKLAAVRECGVQRVVGDMQFARVRGKRADQFLRRCEILLPKILVWIDAAQVPLHGAFNLISRFHADSFLPLINSSIFIRSAALKNILFVVFVVFAV